MNMYDEILNKYADFLGYSRELKADGKAIYKQTQLMNKISIFTDELNKIRRKGGKHFLLGYELGNACVTQDNINSDPKENLSVWQFHFIKNSETPNICFFIDTDNNTYKEIIINEVIHTSCLR